MDKLTRKQIKGLLVPLIPSLITFGFNCFVYIIPKFIVSPEKYIFLDMEIDLYAKVTGMEQNDYVVAFTMRPEGFTEWIRKITA